MEVPNSYLPGGNMRVPFIHLFIRLTNMYWVPTLAQVLWRNTGYISDKNRHHHTFLGFLSEDSYNKQINNVIIGGLPREVASELRPIWWERAGPAKIKNRFQTERPAWTNTEGKLGFLEHQKEGLKSSVKLPSETVEAGRALQDQQKGM